jgi:FKBP-type peptidyl-prolyl cis-trans isomerase
MKTKILLFTTILSGLLLFSCKINNDDEDLQNQEKANLKKYIAANHITATPTADGLYYLELKQGKGATPVDTDLVLINTTWYIINSDGNTTLVGTNDTSLAIKNNLLPFVSYKGPLKLFLSNFGIKGLSEGLAMMKEGGLVNLIVPSNLAYGGYGFYDIPPYSSLVINVELVKVINDPVADDKHFVDQYLDTLQLKESDLTNGIYLKVDKEGTGDSIESYDIVSFQFKDKAMDTAFSIGSSKFINFKYSVDHDTIFRGLRVAIGMLKKGAEARLILPYNMVKGAGGFVRYPWIVDIPPYTSLFYQLVITDVEKASKK